MRHEIPRIETNCVYFHEFTDTRSGKWARIVRVVTVSADSESAVFRVTHAYGPLGGETVVVELRQINGKWKVVECRITAVA